jgi:Domain of unknown function (DUF222)/HNH endonuclease
MEALAVPDTRERLHDAVDALVGEPIDGFTTQALGEDIVGMRREIDRLEAEFLRRLHRFDAGHGALAENLSTVSWLRAGCGMTAKAAAYRVHLARSLGELPAALDSARAGRASFGNVAMIGHLAGAAGVEQVRPYEDILVSAAETLDPGRMRFATQTTRLGIAPDGVLADDNHAHERRWLDYDQTYGNVFVLRGEFDAESGALLKTAIDALSHGLGSGEARSPSKRRADGLIEMAATQLRLGEHRDVHGQRPHLTVTVSAETLREIAVSGNAVNSDTVSAVRRNGLRSGANAAAELRGVGPIHPETARRIACDAVRTVVTVAAPADAPLWTAVSAPVVPLAVGHATRTIPAPLRTALVLRDQGCRFPGCDRPPAWTDGHHIIHWADGGPTELANLVSLCRPHHRRVHEQRWRIHIADGVAVVELPP